MQFYIPMKESPSAASHPHVKMPAFIADIGKKNSTFGSRLEW
jgi:hypothetical protein